MGVKSVFWAASAVVALAAAPGWTPNAWGQSEGNGPAGNDGVFGHWVVPMAAGGG